MIVRVLSVLLGFALAACAVQSSSAQSPLTEHTLRLDESEDIDRAPQDLSALSWMVGHWRGEGLGGVCDESWTPAMAGTMLGTFQLTTDNKVAFTEFFMMSEEDDSIVLRLKHFNPDFTGWETKDKYVTFRLIRIDGQTAWFDGLTYALQENGDLQVHVAMKQQDGSMGEGAFVLRKEG